MKSECCGRLAIYCPLDLVSFSPEKQVWYGMDNIIHSNECVTQGYLLNVVDYRIGIITLIKCLNFTYPDVA